jgi:broad specificity phosphatase PhoE
MSGLIQTGFWFLRHGETDWNTRQLAQGSVETHLNAHGVEQAERAAVALQNRGIVRIFSSPLTRARQTADVVGEALGLIPAFEPDLRETSYGVEEGKVMSLWFDDWVAGNFTPEGAESFEQLTARAVLAVNRCLSVSISAPVLLISHGAFFRTIRNVMGLPRNVRTPNATPLWCDGRNGTWEVTELRVAAE